MYGSWTHRKAKLADKREIFAQLAREWDWPQETLQDGKECGCFGHKGLGILKPVWGGDYIGTDWTTQRRLSYRCNCCGKMVTFFDRTDSDGKLIGEIEKQVITP